MNKYSKGSWIFIRIKTKIAPVLNYMSNWATHYLDEDILTSSYVIGNVDWFLKYCWIFFAQCSDDTSKMRIIGYTKYLLPEVIFDIYIHLYWLLV